MGFERPVLCVVVYNVIVNYTSLLDRRNKINLLYLFSFKSVGKLNSS